MAGNPVLSTPNAGRLDAALATLDFYVAVDPYVNETTRHADVILPPPTALQKGHYDLALLQLALHNVANYSPAVLPLDEGQLDEWKILARLALVAQGMGADADPAVVDDLVVRTLVDAAVGDETGPIAGRDPDEILALLGERTGPERLVDLMLRTGPYGDGFGADPDGLTLDVLLANPHGVDLGALEPRLPDVLRTPSGMVELAPEPIVADVARLRGRPRRPDRRDDPHRPARPALQQLVDAQRRGAGEGQAPLHAARPPRRRRPPRAGRRGDAAEVRRGPARWTVPVEVTDAIRPGVVSIPHGWGHDLDGVELGVARRHAGVNSNLLADDELIDPLSGNAVLNGIPVEVAPA